MRSIVVAIGMFVLSCTAPALPQWQHMAGPRGANVNQIVKFGGRFLIATNRGTYISDDEGRTWSLSNAGLQSASGAPFIVYSLAVAGDTILAGNSGGLHRSMDGGASWSRVEGLSDHGFNSVSAHNGVVVAGSHAKELPYPFFPDNWERGTVFRSTDGGSTWSDIGRSITTSNTEWVEQVHVSSNAILVGSEGRIFLSNNDGRSWIKLRDRVDLFSSIAWSFYRMASTNDTLFVGAGTTVLRSVDAGQTWTKILEIDTKVTDVAVSSNHVVVCAGGLYVSDDGGAMWSSVDLNLLPPGPNKNRYMTTACINDAQLLVGEWPVGIQRSSDRGRSWDPDVSHFGDATILALAEKNEVIIAGTSNGLVRSTDQGTTWSRFAGRLDEIEVRFIEVIDNMIICNAANGLVYSVDDGASWTTVSEGPNAKVNAVAKSRDSYLVATDSGVFKTSLTFASWRRLSVGRAGEIQCTALAVRGDTILVGTDYRFVHRSTNGGETFEPAAALPGGDTISKIFRFAIEGQIALAACAASGGFRSTDLGATWRKMSISPYQITSISIRNGIGIAGSKGHGAFVSTDTGASWQQFNEGLDVRNVLAVMQSSSDWYVGSSYGGVWRRRVQLSDVASDTVEPTTIKATPNPTDGLITISISPDRTIDDVSVTSMLGAVDRLPAMTTTTHGTWLADLRGLSPGVYCLHIRVGELYETTFVVRR